MICPIDGETLVMTDRSGVEIDYCPKCRGVWLDRGELDKVIERAAGAAPPPLPASVAGPAPVHLAEPGLAPQRAEAPRRRNDDDDDDDYRQGKRFRRRDSFLSELFDF